MKISLCIPQYNRIEYLLKNIEKISLQTYPDIEIVISDDCSTDNTEEEILKIQPLSRFPIVYQRSTTNLGYDRNLRKSLEIASGDYYFILGNDDTLNGPDAIHFLVEFLKENEYPEIGFCNSTDYTNPSEVTERAAKTAVIGSGKAVALKYYRSFSFVAGVIIKRESFLEVNTDKFDKSIFVQIYLATLLIAKGKRLFQIKEPLVLKDITINHSIANSYRDTLPRKWSEFKEIDTGLPSVIRVAIAAFTDAGFNQSSISFEIFKGIYTVTYPFWILDYKRHRALVAALGLVKGLVPRKISAYHVLDTWQKTRINLFYAFSTVSALLLPSFVFESVKLKLYRIVKR
jgi:glycosyltransferase involved in cell wall biosynthesis